MNTKQLKKQFLPQYCVTYEVHVFFIGKMTDSATSMIALAAACAMQSLHWICASMCGGSELGAALGSAKVTRLPADALDPGSKVLRRLVQRAREEGAVLLIEAEVDHSFDYDALEKAMDLKRRETLTVLYSLEAHDLPNHWVHPASCGHPDQCIVHAIGAVDDESSEADEHDGIKVPVWYSGLITSEMSDVLARRGHYRGLQPIPEVLCTYGPVPYCSLFNHDVNIDAVIQMLGQANDHAWKHVISHIAEKIA
jgi:hypothetical protein